MNKPLIILEMANNHMGDVGHGKKIINEFHKITLPFRKFFDFAFKFQFRDLDTYIHKDYKIVDYPTVNRFMSTRFSEKNWISLISFTKKKFKIICTPFDELSVNRIKKLKFDYLKIASCSMDEWPLLEHIGKVCKKMKIICSLGGGDYASIRNNISFFENKNIDVKYLYCVAKYPCKPENLNIEFFNFLKKMYPEKIYGFSTHEESHEILSQTIAYSMGARIFEKHVGLKTKKYNLNKYSTTPEDLSKWLYNLKDAMTRCGSVKNRDKFLTEERQNLRVFKRGVFVKKNLKPGEKISTKNIFFAYPAKKNQLVSNDISKFKEIFTKKKINKNLPILYNSVKISDSRLTIENIRERAINLLNKRSLNFNKNIKLEISHHYGIEKFNKFGLCMLTVHNSVYCKKILLVFYNQQHPAQFHKIKQETFVILHGMVRLTVIKNKKKRTYNLKPGDVYTLYPKDIHSFKAVNKDGAIIEELSTKSIKDDSYYVDEKISRNKNRKSFISLY